jgi:Flp pilus assembly protein TadB
MPARRRRKAKLTPSQFGVLTMTKKPVSVPPAPWDSPRDLGATGPANRAGLIIEAIPDSPNKEKRARRVDMLEAYMRRGTITPRQESAGKILREAWLRTECSGNVDPGQPKVDKSPDPSLAVTIAVDLISAFVAVTKKIPHPDAAILHAVACLGQPVSALRQYRNANTPKGHAHLAEALERLAKAMGLSKGDA